MKGKIIERNPILTLLLILALVLSVSIVPVLVPATPVMAAATSVVINQPTTDNITYVAQGGTVTLTYYLIGDGANSAMEFWIYDASGNIGTGTEAAVASDNLTHTKSISLDPVVTAGPYNVKIRADADPATDAIGTGVVVADNTAPTVTLVSPDGGQYFAGGSSQTISWTATDTSSGNVTVTVDYTTNGGGS